MTDYKQTLNLPTTDFPMKASLNTREPEMLLRWETGKIYEKIRKKQQGKKPYILHDGPPYANGSIHLGHALNKVLKDIVVKSKTLSGFDAPFVPGWDCHGLPIELNVEKKHGKAGHKITEKAFREACRAYAESQVDIQREAFKRLGVFGDWANPYLTMSSDFEAGIIEALADTLEQGHLVSGFKPVHWCIDCGSALAEAEVEYQDKTSPAIDVRFVVVNSNSWENQGHGAMSIPIWTTTPWTLPANEAVALNAELIYCLIQTPTERLWIAEPLLETVMKRYGITDYQRLAAVKGEALAILQCQHPFLSKKVPVILGDHVTTDAGTGAVHTAPAHGQDDYLMGLKYALPMDVLITDNGCFTDAIDFLSGLFVTKANPVILQKLRDDKTLLHEETVEHSYPHCWRHKTPLIFRATPQWFISMEANSLREKALKAISTVQWIPSWGDVRIAKMIEGRPDWCLSRQRAWGVPMSLLLHKKTGALHPDMPNLMRKIAERVREKNIEAWYELDLQELLGEQANDYQKSPHTLDVWFDSGVSSRCVLKGDLRFPADLYLEGSDQYRGWFQSSLLASLASRDQTPYRSVLTHGFTVDAQGRKMSKSLGNVIAPEEIINKLGADVLRLWVASTDFSGEITVSNEIFARIADVYRRIRNTSRFLLANLHDFDPEKNAVKADQLLALDAFMIVRARALQAEIIQAYETFQFHEVAQKVHHFCAVDLGGFYLDIIKDRQYTGKTESVMRRSAQTALYHILQALTRWIAPVLSFTSDEIWSYLPGKKDESVFLTEWYTAFPAITLPENKKESFWVEMMKVRDVVNKAIENKRNQNILGSSLEAEVTLFATPALKSRLALLAKELRFVLITSKANVEDLAQKTADAESTEISDLWVSVKASANTKCVRCWHRDETIGTHADHPDLCNRCHENVFENGEVRQYA